MFLHVSFLMVPSLCFSTILLSAGLGHKNSLKIDLENGRTYGMLQSPDHVWLHLRRVASRHVPGHLHCHLCRHRCCCWLSSHMPLGKCLWLISHISTRLPIICPAHGSIYTYKYDLPESGAQQLLPRAITT